jgi:CubicO group peptidase (beta-lactamase class C family)
MKTFNLFKIQFIFFFILCACIVVFVVKNNIIPMNEQHKLVHSTITKSSNIQFTQNQDQNNLLKVDGPLTGSKSNKINELLERIHFNGVVLVNKNGEDVIKKGYGYRDIANKLPNSPDTNYAVGSISKVFVATSLMQLKEKGLISLNDPITKYIPNFPNGSKLTLFHLMTHTSGIKGEKELYNSISTKNLINKIILLNKGYQPIFNWKYNDTNYVLLAYVVEKVTGMSYQDYLKSHVLNRANIDQLGVGDHFYQLSDRAKGYRLILNNNQTPHSVAMPNFSYMLGCGDIYGTVSGLLQMDEALVSNKLISEDSFKQMTTPFKHSYGYGLYNKGKFLYNHGVLPGVDCMNIFDPKSKTFVILFTNSQKMKPNTLKVGATILNLVSSN